MIRMVNNKKYCKFLIILIIDYIISTLFTAKFCTQHVNNYGYDYRPQNHKVRIILVGHDYPLDHNFLYISKKENKYKHKKRLS